MRNQINKLVKGKSTRHERKFMEILKKNHIPFRSKIKVQGREVDFIIGKFVVEVDAHFQDPEKNWMLVKEGYTPLHFANWEIETFENWVTNALKKWLVQ